MDSRAVGASVTSIALSVVAAACRAEGRCCWSLLLGLLAAGAPAPACWLASSASSSLLLLCVRDDELDPGSRARGALLQSKRILFGLCIVCLGEELG